MSDTHEVDLSQIRGDWHFHLNYLSNAVHQTLARADKLWGQVKADAGRDEIGELVAGLGKTWSGLEATGKAKDKIDIASPLLDEFLALAARTKAPCDALEESRGLGGSASIYDSPLEQFTESLRQIRGFSDDLVMMREQQP